MARKRRHREDHEGETKKRRHRRRGGAEHLRKWWPGHGRVKRNPKTGRFERVK